jgi:hypothetical protein
VTGSVMGGDICPKCSTVSSVIFGEFDDPCGKSDEYVCLSCGFRWPCELERSDIDVLPAQVAGH